MAAVGIGRGPFSWGGGGIPQEGLQAQYVVGADEHATIPELGDDSGNGLVLTASSAGATIDYSATAVNGGPGMLGDGTALDLTGATVSDWTFLHSDELTIACYVEPTGGLAGQNILRTIAANAPSTEGCYLLFDGVNDRFWFLQYKASGTNVLSLAGDASSAAEDAPHVLVIRCSASGALGANDSSMRVDGSEVKTANYSSAVSTSAPGLAMRLSGGGTGINSLTGGIANLFLWDRCLTDAEVLSVEARLAGFPSPRARRVVRCLGDSITQNAATYRRKLQMRAARTSNLRLEMVGDETPSINFPGADGDHDGVSGELLSQIEARVAGFAGESPTDVVLIGGTNNISTQTASQIATELTSCISAIQTEHPSANIWVCSIPYGDGTSPDYTAAGKAGDYNALIPAICTTAGVNHVDIHAGSYAWVPGTDAADGIGHPTPDGGDAMGNTLAVAWGIEGD